MTLFWQDDTVTLHLGEAETVLPTLPDASVDAVVCDPPAGVRFMNKAWDSDMGGRHSWVDWLAGVMAEARRCLKPGGHAFVWALPRTSHWTAWALEDAGFEIRDCVLHLFGQGFAKSRNMSKDIDRIAGAEREAVGSARNWGRSRLADGKTAFGDYAGEWDVTAPATEDAKRWDGWGTALKPGQEMWWLARRPLAGTVAANVLTYGTGGINVDGCRVAYGDDAPTQEQWNAKGRGGSGSAHAGQFNASLRDAYADGKIPVPDGRWPTNLVLTHSPQCGDTCDESCPVAELDRQSGERPTGALRPYSQANRDSYSGNMPAVREVEKAADSGGASRYYPVFRYSPKAPAHERPKLPDGTAHPTVKPLDLVRWLVRLVTPPGGLVLDMFAGTGTTGEACVIEGFRCVLVEQDPVNADLARTRLRKPIQPTLGGDAA